MGDRANVYVHDGERPGVYLYTHWDGTGLPETVRQALAVDGAKQRWDDDQYLTRIIFCAMVDNLSGTTGYGISAWLGDGDDRIVDVDTGAQTVKVGSGELVPFSDYVASEPEWPTEEQS